MLLNLKRLYVHMRSFPQARDVTDLILAITPSALTELRDRGLLAYHLNDVTSALRDLQTYLKLARMSQMDDDAQGRARADLGAREGAAQTRRRAELGLRAPGSGLQAGMWLVSLSTTNHSND